MHYSRLQGTNNDAAKAERYNKTAHQVIWNPVTLQLYLPDRLLVCPRKMKLNRELYYNVSVLQYTLQIVGFRLLSVQ